MLDAEVVLPTMIVKTQPYRNTKGHTMSSCIQRKHTTFSFGHITHLLCKAREAESRCTGAMMTYHDSPSTICGFGRGMVYSKVKLSRWHRGLCSFCKERRRRYRRKRCFWCFSSSRRTSGPLFIRYERL